MIIVQHYYSRNVDEEVFITLTHQLQTFLHVRTIDSLNLTQNDTYDNQFAQHYFNV